MPKAPAAPPIPLQGLFPIAKPSGPGSMAVIEAITPLLIESRLFDDPTKPREEQRRGKKRNYTHQGIKIGQGGTLDPLADGVLVIGVNRGTKHLNRFLMCTKEYESIGLLGASTTTYDSEGPIMSTARWDHITREDVEKVLDRFRGHIKQTPPIFSALKMDGKPLYEYARESKPLPRPIEARDCTVSIDLVDFQPASVVPGDGGHEYRWPAERLNSEEKDVFNRLTKIVAKAGSKAKSEAGTAATSTTISTAAASADPVAVPDLEAPDFPEVSERTGVRPPSFTVRMTVSSGTYVRSIVHDIGLALGTVAHVVKLTRTRQGEFVLHGDEEALAATGSGEAGGSVPGVKVELDESAAAAEGEVGPSTGCIPWSVWERAIEERKTTLEAEKRDEEEMRESGASAEEIQSQFSKAAIAAKRRTGDLKEWENEMLRRFHSVPAAVIWNSKTRAERDEMLAKEEREQNRE